MIDYTWQEMLSFDGDTIPDDVAAVADPDAVAQNMGATVLEEWNLDKSPNATGVITPYNYLRLSCPLTVGDDTTSALYRRTYVDDLTAIRLEWTGKFVRQGDARVEFGFLAVDDWDYDGENYGMVVTLDGGIAIRAKNSGYNYTDSAALFDSWTDYVDYQLNVDGTEVQLLVDDEEKFSVDLSSAEFSAFSAGLVSMFVAVTTVQTDPGTSYLDLKDLSVSRARPLTVVPREYGARYANVPYDIKTTMKTVG